jgi:hypothetical protein
MNDSIDPFTLATIRDQVLHSGQDDWVSLDEVSGLVKKAIGPATSRQARFYEAAAVLSLLRDDRVRIGEVVVGRGFIPWTGDQSDIERRVLAVVDTMPSDEHAFAFWLDVLG